MSPQVQLGKAAGYYFSEFSELNSGFFQNVVKILDKESKNPVFRACHTLTQLPHCCSWLPVFFFFCHSGSDVDHTNLAPAALLLPLLLPLPPSLVPGYSMC